MHKLIALLAALIFLLIARDSAPAASFDCGRARTPDEVAICGNRDLNDLDVRMATLLDVTTGLVAMGQRGAIRDGQRDWLATRRQCGGNVPCLRRSYRSRIAMLQGVLDDIKSRGPF
jgi:uncharacterized protein